MAISNYEKYIVSKEPSDWKKAIKKVENERYGLQRFMDTYINTDEIIFEEYSYPSPSNKIKIADSKELNKGIELYDLFNQLRLPKKRLKEIFSYGYVNDYPHFIDSFFKKLYFMVYKTKRTFDWKGKFTKEGKQNLADMLNKKVIYTDFVGGFSDNRSLDEIKDKYSEIYEPRV